MKTPIESYKGILLKRHDKFILGETNGGKLQQALRLVEDNLKDIKTIYNNQVICSCSIKSPQSAIISEVCKKYKIDCNIVTYKTLKPNRNLSIAHNGAKIYGLKSGYNSVIEHYARELSKKLNGFYINMGFASKEAVDSNIYETYNLPDDLDYLVVTIGSAMNFISILKGIKRFDKKVKNIIGIIVGKSPEKILSIYKDLPEHTLIKSPYKYGQEINIDSYFFDPIYEAKGYEWLMKNIDIEKNKVLFWVIGKRNMEFKPIKINYEI